jgi:glycine zipper 2TM protein
MKNLMLMLAGLSAVSACSEVRDRRVPQAENSAQRPDLTLPDTASLSDTSFTLSSRAPQPVSPVEQAPPAPKRKAKPTRPAKPARAIVDTSTRAYAPNPPPDTAPAPRDTTSAPRDTAPAPRDTALAPRDTAAARDSITVDSAIAAVPDTTVAPKPDSAAAPAPDTLAARTPDTAAVAAAPAAAARAGANARTLPIGTEIHAALDDSITSRRDTVGSMVAAHVMENVTGPDGRTLIAAGTPVRFTVTQLSPAKSKGSQGRLTLRADGIALNGQLRPVKADVRPIPRELKGRGVTGSDAAKVGVGAAGGAVLGRVVGGNTRGAVIGGVAGAAAGAVVASQTATRDVVVKAKTPVVIVLTQPLTAP